MFVTNLLKSIANYKTCNEISVAFFTTFHGIYVSFQNKFSAFCGFSSVETLCFFRRMNAFFCAVVNLSQIQRYIALHIIAKSVNTAFCKSFETVADNNRLIKRATI